MAKVAVQALVFISAIPAFPIPVCFVRTGSVTACRADFNRRTTPPDDGSLPGRAPMLQGYQPRDGGEVEGERNRFAEQCSRRTAVAQKLAAVAGHF